MLVHICSHNPTGIHQGHAISWLIVFACLQTRVRAVQQKLAQTKETLAEALSLALQHNLLQVLSQICVDLVECYSQYDPAASGQYLALLQVRGHDADKKLNIMYGPLYNVI